jgi:hypothetical protein
MSDTVRILFRNREPYRILDENTPLIEVYDYYEEKLGRQARYIDFAIREIVAHPDL